MFYFCAVCPLNLILESSSILSRKDADRVIRGRERIMKLSFEAGTAALLPRKKCGYDRIAACFEKRAELLAKYIDASTFDPPPFPLQVSPQGIFVAGGGGKHADICKSCVACYHEALKNVREKLWLNLPRIFDLKEWGELQEMSAL